MTDTDTPRTTAPVTQGDVLTAEQIAHLREVANGLAFIDDSNLIAADLTALLTSHAALRDRLARAEERNKALEGTLREIGTSATVGYGLPGCPLCGHDMGEPHDDECVIAVALRATPTDGAGTARHDGKDG